MIDGQPRQLDKLLGRRKKKRSYEYEVRVHTHHTRPAAHASPAAVLAMKGSEALAKLCFLAVSCRASHTNVRVCLCVCVCVCVCAFTSTGLLGGSHVSLLQSLDPQGGAGGEGL